MTALGLFLTAAYSAALGSPDYAVREAVTRRLSRDGFGLVVAASAARSADPEVAERGRL
jgi:hypothetical protein